MQFRMLLELVVNHWSIMHHRRSEKLAPMNQLLIEKNNSNCQVWRNDLHFDSTDIITLNSLKFDVLVPLFWTWRMWLATGNGLNRRSSTKLLSFENLFIVS